MKPSEVQKGLDQLAKSGLLVCKDNRYKYGEKYKHLLRLVIAKGEAHTKEAIVLEVLWRADYFKEAKTEEEIAMVANLLLLQK